MVIGPGEWYFSIRNYTLF